jgi:hypothetical protein
MTDEEVLATAYAQGFELDEQIASYTGSRAWGWHRGDDDRWPCFQVHRQALDWMRDRMDRARVFGEVH